MWEIRSQTRNKVVGPYKLTILAVKPDKRKRDLGNLEKAVSDILVSVGVVEDDSLCEWLEIRWVQDGSPCAVHIEAIGAIYENEALLRVPE